MSKLNVTMMDYILETPNTVCVNVDKSKDLTAPLVELFIKKPYKRIVVVASGSSCSATTMARLLMMKYLNIEVKVLTPFTFTNYEHNVNEDDFVICISQSGCSTNTISALRKCKELGILAIGLTGNVESDFKTEADVVIDYGVGEELVGYVTKGQITLAVFMMLFALEAALILNMTVEAEVNSVKDEIKQAMKGHEEMVSAFDKMYKLHRKAFTSMSNLYVIGCGSNIGTIMEGSLKVGETVHIPSFCYEVDEYIHGPNLQLTPNYTVVFIDGGDEPSKRCIQAYHATKAVTDRCFIISNDSSIEETHAIRIPSATSELISPLYNVVFFQLLAHYPSEELKTLRRHPLFTENFNSKISAKSETYVDHHNELVGEE